MMGRGPLSVRFELPVLPGDDRFMISGTLGAMPSNAFNPMMEPLGHLAVRTGRIQRLDFTMEGDAHNGVINMRFAYDSLSVDVLNKDGARSWAGSVVVNAMVLQKANPMPGKELREAHATAVCDPHRSNFNYWWRIVFAGTKESVGLTEAKQQKITALQEKFRDMKARREQRRAEWEQKQENKK
ncbi:MAG: hypothetical protein LBU95_03430 [Rikenellaceae bacterium]|jgi:hypothetical protein|nr:hypothetical protein [Rikenellaceae bacterium]